ncbi:MAG: hypothetical protein L0Y67_02580 [Gammaproteobacteria bacterium]|nr:hypothetical protein [Gammaproteobacteria bacterium]
MGRVPFGWHVPARLFIIVARLIRLRAEALYQTTIIVRGFFCVCLGSFYYISRDPLFLVMLGIVAFGVLLTASRYPVDRKRRDRASNNRVEATRASHSLAQE